jgi:hypothetical protein
VNENKHSIHCVTLHQINLKKKIQMKKHFTFLMVFAIFSLFASAATFYVDPTNGLDTNNGNSWKTAVKSITTATTLASSNSQVDDIFIKGGTITANGVLKMGNENYYGSFEGTESKPSQRALKDNDGNGIIDAWEFKTPTIYKVNYNNTAIYAATALFDGFTIQHKGERSNANMSTIIAPVGGTVQNCIFSECNLTYTGMIIANGGCIVKSQGTVNNCLFEKNSISASIAADTKISPIIDLVLNTDANKATVSGCVVRANKIKIDNSSTTSTCKYIRGLAINVSASTSTPKAEAVVKNCLVYNNDFVYFGNDKSPIAENASVAGCLNYSASNSFVSFENCTFTSNKLTDTRNAVLLVISNGKPDGPMQYKVVNNVFWNNMHTMSSTEVTKLIALSSSSNQNKGTVVNNNIMDVKTAGNWGSELIFENNLTDLGKSNTGKNGPAFKRPTTLCGIPEDDSAAKADWNILPASYINNKKAQ